MTSTIAKLALIGLTFAAHHVAKAQDWDQDETDPSIVGGTAHPCYRECNGTAMVCVYEWTVKQKTTMSMECGKCPFHPGDCQKPGCIVGGGLVRTAIAVNGRIPGPSILVCEGDKVEVHVINHLRTESLTIHWHGVHQEISPFSDGVPYVNQIPISPISGEFRYSWEAMPHGTHIWHGHSGFQESEGLYGPVVIRRDEPEYVKSLYDTDLPGHTAIIWHWYPKPSEEVLVPKLMLNGSVWGFGFMINGKAAFNPEKPTEIEVFNVTAGLRHRFRVIYNSAIYCPLQISVDDHELIMISSDTSPFQNVAVDTFMMEAGERYDFVLPTLENGTGCYWMRIRALGDCDETKSKVHAMAYVCYNGSTHNDSLMPNVTWESSERVGRILNPVQWATYNYSGYDLIHLAELNSTEEDDNEFPKYDGSPNITLYMQVHSRPFSDVPYPGPWHQFNNVTFEFPGPEFMDYLSTGVRSGDLKICNEETKWNYCKSKNGEGEYCKCTLTEDIPTGSLVEMILVDISWERKQDHPIHLHGYTFHIVGQGLLEEGQTHDDVRQMNENGLLPKKLKRAVAKDSAGVPNRGWMAIRFIANNTGLWMFHCHVTNHVEMGMAVLLKVGTREEILNHCHNFNSKQCESWYSGLTSGQSMPVLMGIELLATIVLVMNIVSRRI